jgi:hypothetical protein
MSGQYELYNVRLLCDINSYYTVVQFQRRARLCWLMGLKLAEKA